MVDIGVSKLLTTFNLSSEGIRSALFDSIINDGVTIVLNGTRIEVLPLPLCMLRKQL